MGAPLVAQSVKNLPAVQETQVQPLGWEDPLQKEMVAHLLGKSHEQRSLVGWSPRGCKESGMTERLTLVLIPYSYIWIDQLNRKLTQNTNFK